MSVVESPLEVCGNGLNRGASDARQDDIEKDGRGLRASSHIGTEHSALILRPRSFSSISPPSYAAQEDPLTKQYEAFQLCRANRTAVQSDLQAATPRWESTLKRYQKARTTYETAINPFSTTSESTLIDPDITALRARLGRLERNLESQSTHIKSIQERLHAADTAVERSERDFMELVYRTAQRPPSQVALRTSNINQDVQPRGASFDLAPASPMSEDDVLREAYFRRAADVNILGEQLADHNYDYWSSITERERRQDQDEVLTISDEEFEAAALHRREVITSALDKAIHEADELKDRCDAANLDLNPHNRNIWDLEDNALSETEARERDAYRQTFESALRVVPREAFENAEVLRGTPSDHGSEPANSPASNQRVGTWMESLPYEPGTKNNFDPNEWLKPADF